MPATDPILSVLRQNNNPDIPTLTISNVSYPSLLTIRREFDKFHTHYRSFNSRFLCFLPSKTFFLLLNLNPILSFYRVHHRLTKLELELDFFFFPPLKQITREFEHAN